MKHLNLAGAGTGGRGCLLERGYGERSNCYSLDLLEFDCRGGQCFCFYVCCCISALGWKVHTLCEDHIMGKFGGEWLLPLGRFLFRIPFFLALGCMLGRLRIFRENFPIWCLGFLIFLELGMSLLVPKCYL